jgi:hypothetical protein
MPIIPIYVALVLLSVEALLVIAQPPGPHDEYDRIQCIPNTYGLSIPDPTACEEALSNVPISDAGLPAIIHWPLIYEAGNCRLRILPVSGGGQRPRPAHRIHWPHIHYASWSLWNDCYGPAAPIGSNFHGARV